MWQHILALPLAAKVITVLGVAGLGVWGWIKHRAISEMASAATKTAETWLWGWIGKKIYAAAPPTPATAKPHNERTYRGTFRLYAKHVNYPKDFFFVLEHEGITHSVPQYGLLIGVAVVDETRRLHKCALFLRLFTPR